MQYQPWLEDAGFNVEYTALFDDEYLQRIYSGQKSKTYLFRYYRQRISKLRHRPPPNLAWIEYETLPWLPWIVEKAFLPTSVRFVCDYDDAVFHRYDLHKLLPVRWFLGRKIDHLMQHSELVTAGNPYLADRARHACAERVEIVPTVVDLAQYTVCREPTVDSPLNVGWIGTPETWEAFGKGMHALLNDTLALYGAGFRAVGAKLAPKKIGTLDIVPWTEETEVSAIQSMDIGLMPLADTPWARGKCGYKLIQYMACGLPVVASSVGVNKDIVEHGVNGFLAETDKEWRLAIETLLADAELRRRMGAAGRKKVEESYSLQVWGPRVAQMLRRLADEGRKA